MPELGWRGRDPRWEGGGERGGGGRWGGRGRGENGGGGGFLGWGVWGGGGGGEGGGGGGVGGDEVGGPWRRLSGRRGVRRPVGRDRGWAGRVGGGFRRVI